MVWKRDPQSVLDGSAVLPVMVIEQLEQALPMAEALLSGGISVFEVTLRTPVALSAISAICTAFPEVLVGAGTVLSPAHYDAAQRAGAQFAISPGSTPSLLQHALAGDIPLIPGVATPSEIMLALELGYSHLKFFPAEACGGVAALKAMAAPLAGARFCPTGGIGPHNMESYLALPCVSCVGGSWMLPASSVAQGDWATVTALSRKAINQAESFR
ncbi:MAG: bifunctional 4-hydroxy-2-oxoglutarate aldolase/2-dehydro-3-deoxy-phosphogluconate aldolase [Aeromonadaceae bacterium]